MRRRSIFVNGVIITAVGFLCVLLYKYLRPGNRNPLVDGVVDVVGLMIILFGQYIRASARGYKSERHIEGAVLITDGPYAFVRNPMYLASFLIGLGIVVMLIEWWVIPAYLAFFLFWYYPQIRNEEKWLVKKFGQEYTEYCGGVPCFLPRLRSLISFDAKKYIPLKPAWLKREWKTILAWSLVVVIAEGYEDISSYGLAVFAKRLAFLVLVVFLFAVFAIFLRVE